MEIVQYFAIILSMTVGLPAGVIVSHLAKDEQALLKKQLKKFVLPIRQEIVYAVFAIIFAAVSQTNYLALATIIFLYGILAGSFLFVQNRIRELVGAGIIFVICSMLASAATTFLF